MASIPCAFSSMSNTISEVDFGEVMATFFPIRSCRLLISEFGIVTRLDSATVRVAPFTITTSRSSRAAARAAAVATSPYGVSLARMLRTLVPPPAEPRMPVMSMPAFLKSPCSIATANGAP